MESLEIVWLDLKVSHITHSWAKLVFISFKDLEKRYK